MIANLTLICNVMLRFKMKKLILIMIIISYSFSLEINENLFMGQNIYKEILKLEKELNSNISHKLKNKKVIALEISTLKKLKKLYQAEDKIKLFETVAFFNDKITQQEYLSALYLLSSLQSEINRLNNKDVEIQKKLFSFKSEMQKQIPDESNHSLLLQQLQYAFYKLSQSKISKSLKLYNELLKKEFKILESAITRVDFIEESSKDIIKNIDKEIDSLKDKNLLLNIDKDSEALQDEKAKKIIIKKEKNIQIQTDFVINKKLEAEILLALKWLKEKKQKSFLTAISIIENDIQLLSEKEREKLSSVSFLLHALEENRFDTASVAIASTQIGLDYIRDGAKNIIEKTLFIYEDKAFSIKTIFTFLLFIIIGFMIASIYKNIIEKFRKTNRIKSLSRARMVANSGYYLIMLSTFFIALKSIGLNLHTIFLITGAILLWIALGLQGFISNYAMGILMKIDRSIRIGDLIEIDLYTIGHVDDMDFRSVTLLTGDHVRITIPNSRFITGSFINHSIEEQIRRLHIPFSFSNEIDFYLVKKSILTALEESNIAHIKTDNKRAQIVMTDINRKIIRYSLLVWIDHHNGYDMPLKKSEFLSLIHQSLKKVAL